MLSPNELLKIRERAHELANELDALADALGSARDESMKIRSELRGAANAARLGVQGHHFTEYVGRAFMLQQAKLDES